MNLLFALEPGTFPVIVLTMSTSFYSTTYPESKTCKIHTEYYEKGAKLVKEEAEKLFMNKVQQDEAPGTYIVAVADHYYQRILKALKKRSQVKIHFCKDPEPTIFRMKDTKIYAYDSSHPEGRETLSATDVYAKSNPMGSVSSLKGFFMTVLLNHTKKETDVNQNLAVAEFFSDLFPRFACFFDQYVSSYAALVTGLILYCEDKEFPLAMCNEGLLTGTHTLDDAKFLKDWLLLTANLGKYLNKKHLEK